MLRFARRLVVEVRKLTLVLDINIVEKTCFVSVRTHGHGSLVARNDYWHGYIETGLGLDRKGQSWDTNGNTTYPGDSVEL